jgi:hypothetical protein
VSQDQCVAYALVPTSHPGLQSYRVAFPFKADTGVGVGCGRNPYPVVLLHEDLTEDDKTRIRGAAPNDVFFQRVVFDEETLPPYTDRDAILGWLKPKVGGHALGRQADAVMSVPSGAKSVWIFWLTVEISLLAVAWSCTLASIA